MFHIIKDVAKKAKYKKYLYYYSKGPSDLKQNRTKNPLQTTFSKVKVLANEKLIFTTVKS